MNYGVLFEFEKQKSKIIFTEGESWDEITLGNQNYLGKVIQQNKMLVQRKSNLKFISLKKYHLFCRITTLIKNKNHPRLIIKRSRE